MRTLAPHHEGIRNSPSRTPVKPPPPWPLLVLPLPSPRPQRAPCRPPGGPRMAAPNMLLSGTSNSVHGVCVVDVVVVPLNVKHSQGWCWCCCCWGGSRYIGAVSIRGSGPSPPRGSKRCRVFMKFFKNCEWSDVMWHQSQKRVYVGQSYCQVNAIEIVS